MVTSALNTEHEERQMNLLLLDWPPAVPLGGTNSSPDHSGLSPCSSPLPGPLPLVPWGSECTALHLLSAPSCHWPPVAFLAERLLSQGVCRPCSLLLCPHPSASPWGLCVCFASFMFFGTVSLAFFRGLSHSQWQCTFIHVMVLVAGCPLVSAPWVGVYVLLTTLPAVLAHTWCLMRLWRKSFGCSSFVLLFYGVEEFVAKESMVPED